MDVTNTLVANAGTSPFAWIYRFDGEGRGEPMTEPAPADLGSHRNGYLWIHINLTDTRSRGWIQEAGALPEDAKNMLLGGDEHQRLHGDGARLWGVLIDFGQELARTADTLAPMRAVVSENFILTARRHPLQAAHAVQQAVATGTRIASPLDLFEMLSSAIIDELGTAVEAIVDEINAVEDRVLDDIVHDDRRRLGPLRRGGVRLHRQVLGMHRVFARFDRPGLVSDDAHGVLQRLLQKLDSQHQELHSTIERARLLHEEVTAKLTDETNRQLYFLTILGSLLVPPTFVTGFFGMNTKNLLLADNENGTLIAIGICLAASLCTFAILTLLGRKHRRSTRRPKPARS